MFTSPLFSLTAVSVLTGIALLWVFRWTVNQAAVKKAQSRVRAHLYELMLFTDEPALIWRAHVDLVVANARYLGLMLKPALISGIPMIFLLTCMDGFYGKAPLAPGRETVVTMHLKQPLDPSAPVPELKASSEVTVETPAVRQMDERQVSWRIRASRSGSGTLNLALHNNEVTKAVEVGNGLRLVSERKVSGIANYLMNPGEGLLSGSSVDWVEVRYPEATVRGFGLELHWLVWFLLISFASMMLLKKRFKVVF